MFLYGAHGTMVIYWHIVLFYGWLTRFTSFSCPKLTVHLISYWCAALGGWADCVLDIKLIYLVSFCGTSDTPSPHLLNLLIPTLKIIEKQVPKVFAKSTFSMNGNKTWAQWPQKSHNYSFWLLALVSPCFFAKPVFMDLFLGAGSPCERVVDMDVTVCDILPEPFDYDGVVEWAQRISSRWTSFRFTEYIIC